MVEEEASCSGGSYRHSGPLTWGEHINKMRRNLVAEEEASCSGGSSATPDHLLKEKTLIRGDVGLCGVVEEASCTEGRYRHPRPLTMNSGA